MNCRDYHQLVDYLTINYGYLNNQICHTPVEKSQKWQQLTNQEGQSHLTID
jgi:hypothetical protein